ncbi:MAG: DUF983 domain-containing protein [Cyclobacteriaceae bacterium]|nr:DUF983 domain-containing protein [Cyclobacteriaceae bacterium]
MYQKKAYQAILESKCPKCREGSMFVFPLSKINKFTQMHEICETCGLRFEVEPGFFFGAMYFSYAVNVAVLIITGVIMWLFNIRDLVIFIVTVLSIVILLLPLIFRYSRVLFLHLFGGVKYDDSWSRGE